MDSNNLRRLIQLAKRTGDTLIVTDTDGHDPVVIMDVAQYEALLNLGMLAEDGSDMDNDLFEEEREGFELESGLFDDISDIPMEAFESEEEGRTLFSGTEEEQPIMPHDHSESTIPMSTNDDSLVEQPTHESISEVPGEERFYLEPIE